MFDQVGATDHPIYFWYARAKPAPLPGDKWMIVFGDAGWRARYAEAIAGLLAKWDVAQIQGWIDSWSQQIGAAADSDPHAWATAGPDRPGDPDGARRGRASAPRICRRFVDCERGSRAPRPTRTATASAGATSATTPTRPFTRARAEICGNGIDDNCNGQIDEGC